MDEVARRNDPDVTVDLIPLSDNFAGFTYRYATKEERRRMGQIVHDSRDPFLVSRNWDFGLVLKILGCKVGENLTKRGSTELIELTEGWKSMDTLSFHNFSISFRRFRIRCNHSETPIGYATAFSDDNLDDSGVTYASSRDDNPNASSKADEPENVASGFGPITIGGGAIPAFHELSSAVLEEKDPRTDIAIRVTKPRSAQRYSGGASIVRPTGSLDLYQGAHFAAESAAISRAEVFFEPPDGSMTGKTELGSLFNPYWQVRLAPLTATERTLAQLKQGLLLK